MTLRRVSRNELAGLAAFLGLPRDRKRIARRLRELTDTDIRQLARRDPAWAARVEELRRHLALYPGREDRGGRQVVYALLDRYPTIAPKQLREFLRARGCHYSPGAVRRMKWEWRQANDCSL